MFEQVEEIRKRWLQERPSYSDFCNVVANAAEDACKTVGLQTRVTHRVKEVDSLVRKCIKQVREGRVPTYDGIVDKVGVRIIVRFLPEVELAVAALKNTFNCTKIDYKHEAQKTNEFGYESCHVDVFLPENHEQHVKFGKYGAELQVRTLAQDLWAEMAHELSYKSIFRVSAPELQDRIDRRIYILSALVESADMEFSRINKEVADAPGAEQLNILRTLESQFFKHVSRPYDLEMSMETISVLRKIDQRPVHLLAAELEKFEVKHRVRLSHIFLDQMTNEDRSVFLFQPESLLIFETLERAPLALEEVWEDNFPPKELEKLATLWGKPVFA